MDGDFDPAEYDRKMTEIFNDDYYAAAEDDVKPEFPDVDEELEVEDTWDNYDRNAETCANGEGYETHCEDAEFNVIVRSLPFLIFFVVDCKLILISDGRGLRSCEECSGRNRRHEKQKAQEEV